MSEDDNGRMRRAALLLLAASAVFLMVGLLMPSNREFFEPVIKIATDLANRRGPSHYESAQYPGYIALIFILSGVSLVFSAFAAAFSAIQKSRKADEGA